MKKLIGILSLVALTFSANAQINSGTIITGGFASFNHRMYNDDAKSKSTILTLQPQFGIAVVDDFVVGAWFRMSALKDISSWSVSPFIRYYMNNFYAQAGYGYSYSKVANYTSEGSIIDFELGYAAFLNNNVALEPALYYNGVFRGKQYSHSDFGIKLGLQIYLNRD